MPNEITHKDVENIQQAIQKLEQKLDKTLFDLKRIEAYLYDDDNTSSPGIVQKVREHDSRLGSLEEAERTKKRVFAVLGMIGGAVAMVIVEVVKYLFSHKQ